MKRLTVISFLIVITLCSKIFAQDYQEIKLGDEYFHKNDFEKSKETYEQALRKKIAVNYFYENYRTTLYALNDFKSLDKFLRNLLKVEPSNIVYQIDQGILRKNQNKTAESDKIFNKVLNSSKSHEMKTNLCATHFLKRDLPNQAVNTFLKARSSNGKYSYAKELAECYLILDKKSEMIDELINLISDSDDNLELVQNTLQANLDLNEYEILEKKLFDKIQGQSSKSVYNRLLIWNFVQKKDFYSAFIQAKAIDKRISVPEQRGSALLQLGQIAFENRDYQNAINCFQHIKDNFEKSYYKLQANRLLIESKEELVKTKFPIEGFEIQSLIDDYNILESVVRDPNEKIRIIKNLSRLYSFYLNDHEKAIDLLTNVLKQNRIDKNLIADCKILLGDIYLLKNEPWESTLLYSQAEKLVKDSPMAHLAKLRNAQLSYYEGDFELAQAHLDVLKLATSREISNDAIDLSLLISDNLNLDTSAAAMQEYSSIELDVFQHNYSKAQKRLDQMLINFKKHSLTDEIYWKKAEIYKRTNAIDSAVYFLNKILAEYSEDILADNALFELAEIHQNIMNDSKKSMDLYKRLLMDYPGSIFTAESRKRFRLLRGDLNSNKSSDHSKPHIH